MKQNTRNGNAHKIPEKKKKTGKKRKETKREYKKSKDKNRH